MEALVSILQSVYTVFGFSVEANNGDVLGVLSVFYVLLASMTHFVGKKEIPGDLERTSSGLAHSDDDSDERQYAASLEKEVKDEEKKEEQELEEKEVVKSVEVKDEPKVSWGQRLKRGLERSRAEVWGKLESVFPVIS